MIKYMKIVCRVYILVFLLVFVYYIQIVSEIDKKIKYRDGNFRKTDSSLFFKKNLYYD